MKTKREWRWREWADNEFAQLLYGLVLILMTLEAIIALGAFLAIWRLPNATELRVGLYQLGVLLGSSIAVFKYGRKEEKITKWAVRDWADSEIWNDLYGLITVLFLVETLAAFGYFVSNLMMPDLVFIRAWLYQLVIFVGLLIARYKRTS